MLRWLINKRLDAAEKNVGVSFEYARHVLRVSLRAFLKFTKVLPLAEYRRAIPPEPFYAARVVAMRHDDCGECVQITVNQASALAPGGARPCGPWSSWSLPAVVSASGEEDALRERIRQRYGEEALVELALAIAVGRIFPTTKRALGYSRSCALVTVHV